MRTRYNLTFRKKKNLICNKCYIRRITSSNCKNKLKRLQPFLSGIIQLKHHSTLYYI